MTLFNKKGLLEVSHTFKYFYSLQFLGFPPAKFRYRIQLWNMQRGSVYQDCGFVKCTNISSFSLFSLSTQIYHVHFKPLLCIQGSWPLQMASPGRSLQLTQPERGSDSRLESRMKKFRIFISTLSPVWNVFHDNSNVCHSFNSQ